MKQLLAVVSIEDEVLSHSLNVCIGCSSGANHHRDHENSLVWHHSADTVDFGLAESTLLRVAGARLQSVDASSKVALADIDQLVDNAF